MYLQYFAFPLLSNKQYFISPEGSGFTIDGIGTISTAAVFDFESESRSFSLVIKVVDPGGLFTAGNPKLFLINVNNKDPILSCSLQPPTLAITKRGK
ncbi:cadherin-related family member 3-like [Callithrix jacchus]